jgi:AraC-like DNA-binding protein
MPVEEVLKSLDLSRQAIANSDMFVSAQTMYELVESLAEVSGDPYLGVHVGARLNPWSWPVLARAAHSAKTVGDFLIQFSASVNQDTTAIKYRLEIDESRALFYGTRSSVPKCRPRHNDGFNIAYILSILQGAVGDAWEGNKVIAHLCDPAVVPTEFMGIRLAATDTMGARLSFPSDWLLRSLRLELVNTHPGPKLSERIPPSSVKDALRDTLQPYLHEPDLSNERIAQLCGLTMRTLSRNLTAFGTTPQKEVAHMRQLRAEYLLQHSDSSIAEIAYQVGYTDTTVFTRAFKRWTGKVPSEFRKG